MTAARPRISIVVVSHNSQDLMQDLIESLGLGMRGTDWELVLADNASEDGTVSFVQTVAPMTKVVETGRNAGYAAGINAGVDAADEYDAILILNPDVRLLPDSAATLFGALTMGRVGLAMPRLVDARGELILSIRREPTVLRAWGEAVIGAERAGQYPLWGEVDSNPANYRVRTPVDWAEGSTLMISAECWAVCGHWDETFFLYSEETEYALRARDRGLVSLFVPEAQAVHLEGGSDHPGLWSMLVLNKIRLFRRRNGVVLAVGFWGAQLWREASRAMLGRATSRAAVAALLSPRRLREAPGPHWL